jgi:hypothetical protein
MTHYAQAEWIPSPYFGWPQGSSGRNGYTPRFIILHGTAGGSSAQGIANWFQDPSAQVSAHYIIGTDGHVVCTVQEEEWAWANGVITDGADTWWTPSINPNWISISIEHCKPSTDNSDQLTPAQKVASFALVADICKRWNIPKHAANANGGITGHYSIDPVNRQDCPGPYPWDELWSFLNPPSTPTPPKPEITVINANTPIVSAYFTEKTVNGILCWYTKSGKHIQGAILDWYRKFGQEGLNGFSLYGLPLTDEIHIAGKKHAILQVYERGVLLYDPEKEVDTAPGLPGPVYPTHIDNPLVLEVFKIGQQSGNTSAIADALKQLASITASCDTLGKAVASVSAAATAASTDLKKVQ